MQNLFSPISSAFSTAISGIIMGTTTLKQAMANLAQSILLSFLNMGIQLLMTWIANQLAMMIFGKMAAEQEGMAQAGAGAAAAMASVASIPGIGWAMAPAVGKAHFAIASGLVQAGVAAERGFDVPAGVNPVTQLHQKEMVLPAEYAEVIRGMAGGASIAGAGGPVVNIHTTYADARGIRKLFTENSNELVRGIKNANRLFQKG